LKRKTDLRKFICACRDIWRQSPEYHIARKLAHSLTKKGWFVCATCKQDRELIKVDHIVPIGKEPTDLHDPYVAVWVDKLFCSHLNLACLCVDCHKIKTKAERKVRQ